MTERDGNWPAELREAARVSKAWPFEEARKLVARVERDGFDGTVLFETGYGPSGLPHIGTFGEVARTSMVRHAFRLLTEDEVPTRLLCFSDDMDGLRKVPDNVPNKEALAKDLGKPLTAGPRSVRRVSRASGPATMRGCAPSSTGSASTTSSPAPPIIIAPASSTRRS